MRRYLLGDIRYIIVNPAPKVNIRTKHTAHGAGISAVSALFPGGFFCYTGKTDRGPDGPACGRRAPTARAQRRRGNKMEAVITVVGNDKVGILAQVCTACAEANVNVEEVTQRLGRVADGNYVCLALCTGRKRWLIPFGEISVFTIFYSFVFFIRIFSIIY